MPPTLLANFAPAYILTPAGVAQGLLDKAFQAADPVNGNYFLSSGRDMLIVFNSDISGSPPASSHSFGIKSVADQFGRFADVTYSVAPGATAVIIIPSSAIYTQPNGTILLSATDSRLMFLPIQSV